MPSFDDDLIIELDDRLIVVPPKNHNELQNLGFEESGHTGFTPSILSLLGNVGSDTANDNFYIVGNVNNVAKKMTLADLITRVIKTADELPNDLQEGQYLFQKTTGNNYQLYKVGANSELIAIHPETSADNIVETNEKKVMTAQERTKLNGIENGAQVNAIEGVKVNGVIITPDGEKIVNILMPTDVGADLSYNATTGVLSLVDKNGNVLGSVDLPLELLIQSGYYDSTNREIVLVLANNTPQVPSQIRIPVGDLVDVYTGDNVNIEVDSNNVIKFTQAFLNRVSAIETNLGGHSIGYIEITANSGTLTAEQIAEVNKDILILNLSINNPPTKMFFWKETHSINDSTIYFIRNRMIEVSQTQYRLTQDRLSVNITTGVYSITSNNITVYTKDEIDNWLYNFVGMQSINLSAGATKVNIPYITNGNYVLLLTVNPDATFDADETYYEYNSSTDEYTVVRITARNFESNKSRLYIYQEGTPNQISFPVGKSGTVALLSDITNYQEVTYQTLKALRDNSQLVKGMQYRITDYQCTTTTANTSSAGHQFDIIVIADDVDKLNENARACLHSGDTYFARAKLEAWQLKYRIDNDNYLFDWADSTNGKGVIYYMKDEFDNECPYDFKNILFNINGTNFYTFSDEHNGDGTIYHNYSTGKNCIKNIIKSYIDDYNQFKLTFNIIKTDYLELNAQGNIFEAGARYNTIENHSHYNIIGRGCYNVNLAQQCCNIKVGDDCKNITIGDSQIPFEFIEIDSKCNYLSIISTDTSSYVGDYRGLCHIHSQINGVSTTNPKTIDVSSPLTRAGSLDYYADNSTEVYI